MITEFQNGVDNMRFSGVENTLGTGLQGFVDALNVTVVSGRGGGEGDDLISYEDHIIIVQNAFLDDIGLDDFLFV